MDVYITGAENDYERAWAYVISKEDGVSCSYGKVSTNDENYLEILAIYKLLQNVDCNVIIHTNKSFVMNGLRLCDTWSSNNWQTAKGKPVKYKDMWELLFDQKHRITFENQDNVTFVNMANELCKEALST